MGILRYPFNASGSYVYASRLSNVTFGGAATWASVLSFEKILEQGLIQNDGTYGYATDPTVRDKWQQVAKLAAIHRFSGKTQPIPPTLSGASMDGAPSARRSCRLPSDFRQMV
jgi:hypothetical protein